MAGRGIVRLSSDRDIVNDGHEHGGPSASRSQPVVIGGDLYFQTGRHVGGTMQADLDGISANDHVLLVAAAGQDATINIDAAGDAGIVQVERWKENGHDVDADDVALSMQLGRISAQNAWLAARADDGSDPDAASAGHIILLADSKINVGDTASLLAGNGVILYAGAVAGAGQRLNVRMDRDDRSPAPRNKPLSVMTIQDGVTLTAPQIHLYGSDTGVNQIDVGAALLIGDTRIAGGSDADIVRIGKATFQGGLHVLGDDGNDDIRLSDTTVAGHLLVDAGAGDDTVWMDTVTLQGGACVLGQDGDDYIYLSAASLA